MLINKTVSKGVRRTNELDIVFPFTRVSETDRSSKDFVVSRALTRVKGTENKEGPAVWPAP